MFKGAEGRKNIIKVCAVILVCLGVVLALRIWLNNKAAESPQAGETLENVITLYNVEIPEFDGETYTIPINDNESFFTEDEIKKEYFVTLSQLDERTRVQTAIMCADGEHLQSGEHTDSNVSSFEPTGWKENGIYERSRLLMWELMSPDQYENFMTGTEYFNEVLMPEYENRIIEYLIANPDNHIMYRVTPYFIDKNKVATGVLMEAYSVEDEGELQFCVFVYNAQPGSEVEYDSGTYHMYEKWQDAVE